MKLMLGFISFCLITMISFGVTVKHDGHWVLMALWLIVVILVHVVILWPSCKNKLF